MGFVLKPQRYGLRYLLGLPFACEPLCTTGVVAQKVITGVVNVLWVLVEAEFIDRGVRLVTGGETFAGMLPLLAAMLLIVAWKRMGYNFGRILTRRIEISAVYQMGVEAVRKRARLKFKLIEDEKVWELSNRISRDMKENVWNMTQDTCNFILGLVRIVGVFLIIFAQSMALGLGCLLLSLPVLLFSIASGKKTYSAYKEAAVFARRGDYLGSVMADRESVNERALFSYVDYVNGKWREQFAEYRKISVRAVAQREARNGVSTVMTNTIATMMVCFLILELGRGNLTIGVFIALSKAIYDMIDLMHNNIGRSLVTIARYGAYMKDLTAFANMEEQEDACGLPEEAPAFESLEFRHVTFRYPGTERYILKDFSLKLEAGKHYAFVGENGAGKTTLTKLLTGLYDDYQGEILINGRELREYTQGQLKGIFTGVWQDFAHYYDTVANNILLGDIRGMDGESALKRAEGENAPKRMKEESAPTRTEGENAPKRMKEESAPTRTEGENAPKRMKEESAPTRMEGENAPKRMKEESAPTRMESESALERMGAESAPKRIEAESVLKRMESENALERMKEENAPTRMTGENALQRMEEHLRELGIREEMHSLPRGYDTPLGKLEDGSVDLSGGQWQRVAMARCLMSPASVQILDEPTAALDPISESRLYEEFEKISRGRTTIFISHRLGSTGLADEIFVLQDGRVAESGSHGELMELRGMYARMYESQRSWYQGEKEI